MAQNPPLTAYHTYNELMDALQSLCMQRSTGTLFIATPDNHFGRIVLKGGDIISLIFGTKSGMAALPFIRAIRTGKFTFTQGHTPADGTENLPPAPELLRRLNAGATPVGATTRSPVDQKLLGQVYRIVEGELVEFVGPIANLVCSEHKGKFGPITQEKELRALLESIGREIGDPLKARQFIERVRERMAH
jgi:hypothetical protein